MLSPDVPSGGIQVAAFFDTATLRGKAAAAAGGLQRTPALLSVAGRCHEVQVHRTYLQAMSLLPYLLSSVIMDLFQVTVNYSRSVAGRRSVLILSRSVSAPACDWSLP